MTRVKQGVAGALTAIVMSVGGFMAGTAVPQRDPVIPPLVEHAPRSTRWPTFRDHYLKEHPACIVCGTTHDVQVHHLLPFHLHPELELDPLNVRTFCRRHHFILAHLENWSSWNETAEKDALIWKDRLDHRPKDDGPLKKE